MKKVRKFGFYLNGNKKPGEINYAGGISFYRGSLSRITNSLRSIGFIINDYWNCVVIHYKSIRLVISYNQSTCAFVVRDVGEEEGLSIDNIYTLINYIQDLCRSEGFDITISLDENKYVQYGQHVII